VRHLKLIPASALLTLVLASACSGSDGGTDAPPVTTPPSTEGCLRTDLDTLPPIVPHTARWAFEPWISKDISDRADRGIPVGAVVLDSPWETQYNTFIPNPARYGDFNGLVNDMHARNVKVVLWITAMVNESSFDFETGGDTYAAASPNFEEGQRCKYFIDDGSTSGWWKGLGASLDFYNPSARAWWHRQQDVVLGAGIDGWKLDFGESYVKGDTVTTAEGPKPHQEYSERYYEDFLAYGRQKRGQDFVTMVRAWDESYEFKGRFFAKKEHAPVSWMGDNRRDWVGLEDALDEMFISAKAGYGTVGSDIGGYLDHDDKNLLGPVIPFDSLNFARWTAVGALSPFMQLHGRGAIAPWTMPDHADETVALYKYWATFHHALVPFLYSLSEQGYAAGAEGKSMVQPVGEPATWPKDYRYVLGHSFLVAPLLDATGKRTVALPAGDRWYDWWSTNVAEGGTSATADFATDRLKLPLWVREGAIIPMDIDNDVLGLGTAESKGARTILIWPSLTSSSFETIEEGGAKVTTTAQASATGWTVTLSALPAAVILRVHADPMPATITGVDITSTYDAATKTSIIKAPARAGALTITATNPQR
jgi:alpha-glucosidase (family GH31 glycosyl hydrolase)